LSLNGEIVAAFVQLGDALVSGFGLRGLFGVDCVLRDGVPYPVEINPRYTASVEVVEHALGIATMGLHRLAFTAEPGIASSPLSPPGRGVGGEAKSHQSLAGLPLTPNPSPRRGEGGKGEGKTHQSLTGSPLAPNPPPRWREGGKQVIGIAILFARERLVIPSAGPWTTALDLPITELPPFADIPHAGEVIDRGQPILTVLARADGVDRCLDDLRQRVHALDHWLFGR